MRYISVCSGIEAASVAWRPLGWQPAMFAEIDPFCCALLCSRYRATRPICMPSPHDAPDTKEAKRRAAAIRNIVALPADGAVINAGDFTQIGAEDVGAIDLLAGGTPCQSFSVAGLRAGLDDPRGNLTIEFARLAGRLRPVEQNHDCYAQRRFSQWGRSLRNGPAHDCPFGYTYRDSALWLVWENVPGILSIDRGRAFGAFLGMLGQLGYGLAYRLLDAQHFGIPQRRRRVFVVGHLGDWRAAAAVLLERGSLSGHPPPRPKARQGAAGGIAIGPFGGRLTNTAPTLDAGAKNGCVRYQLGAGVLAFSDVSSRDLNAAGMERQQPETEILLAHALPAEGFDASEDGTGRGVPVVPVAFPAKDHGRDEGSLPPTPRGRQPYGAQVNDGQLAVAFTQNQAGDVLSGEIMHALGTNPNATGRNAPTVAYTLHGSDGTAGTATPASIAGAVRTRAPGGIENSSTTIAQHGLAVRRLTPRECERLQGFPDDYTLIEYRGRPAADGPRYRALGNSMAVPVMRWIGGRIASVEAILRDRPHRRKLP